MNQNMSYMRVVKIAVPVVLTIILVTVVLQNREEVETHLLFYTVTMPQAALLGVILVAGYLLGIVTMIVIRHGSNRKRNRAEEKLL